MKRSHSKKNLSLHSRKHQRGIALILVLACLVLLVVMVLAFLGSIGTELRSSKFYANGSSVKLLAQSTTDLVMAEIRDATANGAQCWASQPGMIRTYDNTGKVVSYYKLYSDDAMITGTFDHTKALVPDGTIAVNNSLVPWFKQQGVYVDLNEPVTVNGTAQYPIVDGSSSDYVNATFSTGASTSTVSTLTTYITQTMLPVATTAVKVIGPISLTGTVSTPQVAGFWLNSNTPADPSSINLAPMPVKWLYVLKDGNMAVPDTDTVSGTTVTFGNSAVAPTKDNPIVGRMAFWTDDETCKVNVNTASAGVSLPGSATTAANPSSTGPYWAAPIVYDTGGGANSASDIYLGRCVPVNHEYQRYPGHPATVSLNTIFPSLTGSLVSGFTQPTEAMFSITPRLGPGGSVEGTYLTTKGGTNAITLNSNRLYSTVDEYLFQPALTGAAASSTRLSNSGIPYAPSIATDLLRKTRFVLTANSRAPDVNVFNQPRVGMWPINASNTAAYRTPFDQLIAFCGQVGKDGTGNPYIYYFQRSDPTSSTNDLPSAGSTSGVGRNRMLLNYLGYLTSQQIPGFGGSLANKYNQHNTANASVSAGTDIDQILTEIFDYIRCTNLRDSYLIANGGTPFSAPLSAGNIGVGQVIPIVDANKNTRGFGRMATVEGGAFQFIANADSVTNPTVTGSITPPDPLGGTITPVANGKTRIQACFFPQLITVSPGSPYINHNFTLMINGLDGFAVTDSAGITTGLGLSSSVVKNIRYNSVNGFPDSQNWGDAMGISVFRGTSDQMVGTSIDVATGTLTFSGGDVTAYMLPYGSTTTSGAYQKIVLHFPGCSMPTPIVFSSSDSSMPVTDPLSSSGTFVSTGLIQDWGYTGALDTSNGNYFNMRKFFYEGGATKLTWASTAPGTTVQTATGSATWAYHGRLADTRDTYGPSSTAEFIENPATSGGTLTITGTGRDVVRAIGAYDPRMVAAQYYPESGVLNAGYPFTTIGGYTQTGSYTVGNHTFWTGDGKQYFGAHGGALARNLNIDYQGAGGLSYKSNAMNLAHLWGAGLTALNFSDAPYNGTCCGTNTGFTGAVGQVTGDWDNGIGPTRDGPFINKPDEGDNGTTTISPYQWKGDTGTALPPVANFSPNRMVPSPGILGSLPTGVFAGRPYQTLLFRPGPMGHPGLGTSINLPIATTIAGTDQGPPYTTQISSASVVQGPPDHLFLDLFHMPVVEPYAISEPLSTAGRINMNHLIVPFTYINRDTGLRSLLISEKVIAADDIQAMNYKNAGSTTGAQTPIRFPVNMDATLSQFYDRRFNKNDIFRSPSEICDIDIVPDDSSRVVGATWDPGKMFTDLCAPPVGITGKLPLSVAPTRSAAAATSTNPYPGMDTYWNWSTTTTSNVTVGGYLFAATYGHRLTGDNSRERIYATLYPRLTTKSNTFTIHFRVQTLQPIKDTTNGTTWREGTDIVTAEYRGSQTIERYVDPNDRTIPDFAANPSTTQTLAPYYHFRVLSTKQFSP